MAAQQRQPGRAGPLGSRPAPANWVAAAPTVVRPSGLVVPGVTIIDPPDLAVSMSGVDATLTWSSSQSDSITSYDLYRRTPPTGEPFVPGTDTPVATGVSSPYSDTGLTAGDYEWQVFGVVGAPWDPSSVSPFAWYDFSDSGSVTLSGSNITDVTDQSGNGNTISQATGGNQPTYVDTVNGLNVGTFTSNKWLVNASISVSGAQPYTLFIVVNVSNFIGYGMIFGNATQTDTVVSGIGTRASTFMLRASNNGTPISSVSPSTGTTYAVVALMNSSSSSINVTGTTDSSLDPGTNGLGSQMWISSQNSGLNDSFYGKGCEFFAAAGDQTAHTANFRSWAASKWGAV